MTNNKFSRKRYDNQSQQLSLIFDLLRHSLKELNNPGFRRFMENMRLPEKARLNKLLAIMSQIETGLITSEVTRRHSKEMSRNLPVTRTLKWVEYKGQALLALNSSELIIRIALFEAFLKDIHRQALLAKPQLLSLCKPNRPVQLKDIFQGGFERFKLSEIDRQVRETDRLTIKDKARFFRQRLKLPWYKNLDGERDLLKRIEELFNLRHKLVHSDPSASVTDNIIKDARDVLKKVSFNCVWAAAKIYPDHFALT
jgi:hypothetical protein